MCGGGHRGYKCRSIDTDYQSNCITVTIFISTYLFAMRSLSVQPKPVVYDTEIFCHHQFVSIPTLVSLDCFLRRPLTKHLPNPVWAGFRTSCPLVKHVSFLCAVAESANHVFCRDQSDKNYHQTSVRVPEFLLVTNMATNVTVTPYSPCPTALRSVPPSVALERLSKAPGSISLEF